MTRQDRIYHQADRFPTEAEARHEADTLTRADRSRLRRGTVMTDNTQAMNQARAHLDTIQEAYAAFNALEDGAETAEYDGEEYTDADTLRDRLQEYPLEVAIRTDWHSPGSEDSEPTEYKILLCTGGPAVRIVGKLGRYCEPDSAEIQGQDWFTPWETLDTDSDEGEALLWFASLFWYGED